MVTAGIRETARQDVARRTDEIDMPSNDAVAKDERDARLVRECHVFVRYLIGAPPSEYIIAQYLAGHARQERLRYASASPFDRLVVRIAGMHPAAARLADSYCWFAARRSLLRRKLFLLAAILESTAPTHRAFWVEGHRSRKRALAGLVFAGARAAIILALSVLLLAPVHLVVGAASRLGLVRSQAGRR